MKLRNIMLVTSLASTLCFAQAPAAQPPAAQPPAAPTAKEIQQEIDSLTAVRQVFYERLEKITEFQKFIAANDRIGTLRNQLQQAQQAKSPTPDAAKPAVKK